MLSSSEMHKIAEVLQSELFILSYINRIKEPDKFFKLELCLNKSTIIINIIMRIC